MNWLDAAIMIILFLNMISGLRKGFITTFFGVAGIVASLYTALFYHNRITLYLNSNYSFMDKIKMFLDSKLTIPLEAAGTRLNDMAHVQLQQNISGLDLPEPVKNMLIKNASDININFFGGAATLGNYVTTIVSDMIVNLLSFLIVFMAVKLVFSVITFFLDQIAQREGLSFYNRLIGLGFGAVKGIIIVMILITVLTTAFPMAPIDSVNNAISSSKLFKILYMYNFIPILLSRYIT